jgi:hypothetical protein
MTTPDPEANVSFTITIDREGNPLIDIYWENYEDTTVANLATLLQEGCTPMFKASVLAYLVKKGKESNEDFNFIFKMLSVWGLLEQAENKKNDELCVRPTEVLNLRKQASEGIS